MIIFLVKRTLHLGIKISLMQFVCTSIALEKQCKNLSTYVGQ